MKNIIITLSLVFLLSSCFGPKEDLDQAKADLGVKTDIKDDLKSDSDAVSVKDGGLEESENTGSLDETPENSDKVTFEIKNLTLDQFIELDDLSSKISSMTDSLEVTGKTVGSVDKIIVSFLNRDSDYPIDKYTLSQFKAGDKTFIYRIKSQFKVLDYGLNEYVFEAHSGESVSKLQLNIFVPEEKSVEDNSGSEDLDPTISYEKKLIGDEEDSVYLSLPKSELFGDPISTLDTITYSNINGLQINKEELTSDIVSCEKLTEYLGNKISTWYYWNTCRDIIKDDGISYYVLKLDGDTYTYEKHYVDYKHNLYGIYTVKTSIEADKENIKTDIADKNNNLKEQNEDFKTVDTVDLLFKEIVR